MRLIGFLLILLLFSCEKPDPQIQKEKLGGYWEILSVESPDGLIKEYSISTIVDFIELEDANGFRTKVAPQLDGSFITNGVAEKFEVKVEDDSLRLYYETHYDSWKETVLMATDSLLTIINSDKKVFSYKKFRKFNFNQTK